MNSNLIIDVPLPPSPEFVVVNESAVQVEWEAPFTWQGFPISNYTVQVINHTSEELVAMGVLTPDTQSYILKQTVSPSFCTNLTFFVLANNSVGASMSGRVQGAFPSREFNIIMQ